MAVSFEPRHEFSRFASHTIMVSRFAYKTVLKREITNRSMQSRLVLTLIAVSLSIRQSTNCLPMEKGESFGKRIGTSDETILDNSLQLEKVDPNDANDTIDAFTLNVEKEEPQSNIDFEMAAYLKSKQNPSFEEYREFIFSNDYVWPFNYVALLRKMKSDNDNEDEISSGDIPIALDPNNYVSAEMNMEELIEVINESEKTGESARDFYFEDPTRPSCTICREPLCSAFRDDETTTCGHKFHFKCISNWIHERVHHRQILCPICRAYLRDQREY